MEGQEKAGDAPDLGNTLVSVIIPARNEQPFIQAALASVAGQRYPPELIECIVVDNASTDGTAAAALEFADSHPGLTVSVVREPAVGVGAAKNRGARSARGAVLLFLDADSRMQPGLVRDVVEQYRRGFPVGSIRITADSRHPLERGFFALMELGKVLFGVRSQMLYSDRRLFLTLGGFHPDFHIAEDLDFLRRVREWQQAHGGKPVCHIRSSAIATSPRRLRERPLHLSVITVFARWALAFAGIGRSRKY
jgi:glycosyltransferase involved in cell wall biosynthesis